MKQNGQRGIVSAQGVVRMLFNKVLYQLYRPPMSMVSNKRPSRQFLQVVF